MRVRFLLLLAAAAAVSLGPAVPAFASFARSAGAGRGTPGVSTGRVRVPATNSPSFAGYSLQGGGEGSFSVTTRIVVPKLACSTGSERAIDPSVGVYNAKNFSSAGVFVGCYKGKADYFPSLNLNGTNHNLVKLTPHPGDTVVLHVAQSSKQTLVSVADKSRKGIKKTLTGAGSKAGSGPWVGDSGWENPGLLSVPKFGTLHFSGSTLNGQAFGSLGTAIARFNRVNGTTTQIKTDAFASNHESFGTVFKHS